MAKSKKISDDLIITMDWMHRKHLSDFTKKIL